MVERFYVTEAVLMEKIRTQRLTLTLADITDLPVLAEIDKECDKYFAFDPPCEDNHNCTLEECLSTGDIPTGIHKEDFKRENYYFYCIWQGDMLIGFLSYYLEYQQKDTVYLSVLYIKEAYRKGGIGVEILDALTHIWGTAHFKTIRLHCSLRNSMALQFWVKNGFNHIVSIECNGNLFPENFGGMELMKVIPSRE
jgi:GNAT superfamily N-acetyltransferase